MMEYVLEHQYYQGGLSFQRLKNIDRVLSDVLITAKSQDDFDLYMDNILLQEDWTASHNGCGDYTAVELCNEYLNAINLKFYNTAKIFSSIEIEKDYIIPKDHFDEVSLDNEYFQEVTGNEGH